MNLNYKSLGICLATTMAIANASASPKQFEWQNLNGFEGESYRGLVFDDSSDSFIKKVFASDKGAYRPEGFLLKSIDPNIERVEILLNGRGSKATLTAIRISPSSSFTIDIEDLQNQLGTKAIEFYDENRFSDWGIAKFPDKGVLASFEYTLSESTRYRRVTSIILTTARRASVRDGLLSEPTPIDSLERHLERLDRRISVSDIALNISSVKLRNLRSHDELDLQYIAQRELSERFFVSDRNGGDINVSVNIDKKGNVNVNASLNSYNEIGKVSISSSDSCRLKCDEDGYVYYSQSRVEDTVEAAIHGLSSSADYTIRHQKLPTERSKMRNQWDKLTDYWTKN